MSRRSQELANRRVLLVAQCAAQRRNLAYAAALIDSHLGGIDHKINVVRGLVRSPLTIAGGIAVLAMIGPSRILKWLTRGMLLTGTVSRVLGLLRR